MRAVTPRAWNRREMLAAAIPPARPASQDRFRREKDRRPWKVRPEWYGRHKAMVFHTSSQQEQLRQPRWRARREGPRTLPVVFLRANRPVAMNTPCPAVMGAIHPVDTGPNCL